MVQLSALHELQHDDCSQDCEICVLASDIQSSSFQLQPPVVINAPVVVNNYKQAKYEYIAFVKATSLSSHLSIRPPPTV